MSPHFIELEASDWSWLELELLGWNQESLSQIPNNLTLTPHLVMDAEQSADVEVTVNHPMSPDQYQG